MSERKDVKSAEKEGNEGKRDEIKTGGDWETFMGQYSPLVVKLGNSSSLEC